MVETYSSNLHPNEDEIQLLRLKLEEAQCKNRVIQEEMNNLKTKVYLKVTFFQKVCGIFQIAQKMCQQNYPKQEIWQFTGKFFVIFVCMEFP